MPKTGKLTVVRISQTRDIDVKTVNYKDDHAIVEKNNEEPQFDLNSVFRLKVLSTGPFASIRNLLKFRRPAVIWIEGKPFCEKLVSKDGDLLEPITNEDRKNIVRREIVKVLAGAKVFKNWMFGALLALGVLIIIMQLLLMGGVHFG